MSASPTDHQWVRRVVTANTAEGTATIATDVRHRVESSGKDGPAAVDLWKTTPVDDELLAHGTMTTGTPSGHHPVEQRDAGGVVVDGGGRYHHRDQQAQHVDGQSALAAGHFPVRVPSGGFGPTASLRRLLE